MLYNITSINGDLGRKITGTILGATRFNVEALDNRLVITITDSATQQGFRLDASTTYFRFDRMSGTTIKTIWEMTP